MRDVIQALIDGLLLGGVYALLAAGLALIFGVMKIVNFSQGALLMVSMYITYSLWRSTGLDPYILAVPVGIVMFAFGALLSRTLIDRIPRGNMDATVILTLGLAIVLESVVLITFGAQSQTLNTGYSSSFLAVGGVLIPQARLYAALAAVVVMSLLYVFLTKAWFGKAIRATADDVDSASVVGIRVKRVDALAFGIGASLAGVAGALLITYQGANPHIGNTYVILMFIAVALGGLGSIGGAVAAAVLLGLLQSFSILLMPLQLQAAVVFATFLLVLVLRPHGLFGAKGRV